MERNLIGYYKVAKETGSKFVPLKRSHNAIQHNIERLLLNNIEMPLDTWWSLYNLVSLIA